ncbi:MAG: alpha/beta fold hydrolase [Acidobacteriota bacterium]|nr:alpha/beta fold hydrolase [Acidobacteriota bacterium]
MLPIVLAHGIARFDILREKLDDEFNLPNNPLEDELQYFKNIRTYLGANGFPSVFNTNVNFAGSVELRAAQLKNRVDEIIAETGAEKVHIIAHSMGGLDARRMIVDLDMAEKVASLTTIGTPHMGTILADRVIAQGGNLWIDFLQKAVKLNLDGFRDLTIEACEAFNKQAENEEARNSVFYQTYSSFEEGNNMFLPLVPSWFFIRSIEGRNDGLVPVKSQQWKSELIAQDGTRKSVVQKEFPLAADHLNQVGWWDWQEVVNPLFGGSFINQKMNYEGQIKNIYLAIASDLQNL